MSNAVLVLSADDVIRNALAWILREEHYAVDASRQTHRRWNG
jgi:hypothetical protein